MPDESLLVALRNASYFSVKYGCDDGTCGICTLAQISSAKMPAMDVIFVQTGEPSGPFSAKSVAEISIDGVAPAIASAIHDATGQWMRELPYTPERIKSVLLAGLE